MAEPKHRERKPKHAARKKAEQRTLWDKLKGSALFWLLLVVGFTVLVVVLIVLLSRLLSGA